MAFATINYHSRSLQKASSFNIVFPDDPAIPRPWSVFYLLHGLSDDHTIWMRRTSIERYVEGLPLVVVMPDGGRGWYTNAARWVRLRGRPDQGCRSAWSTGRSRSRPNDRGEPSAGSRWAVTARSSSGLKHHEMFASVNSHSGAVGAQRDPKLIKDLNPEFERIFGKSPKGGPEDPAAIVERIDHGRIPALSARLRHRRLPARTEPGVPSPSRVAARPARIPASFPAAITGPTGTSTFRKPSRFTHVTCS